MSDSKLTQTFTTDDTKLIASYERIIGKQQQILAGAVKLAQESRRAGSTAVKVHQDQGSAIGKATAQLAHMTAGYVGVRTVIGTVTAELEKMHDLESRIGQAQKSLADPRMSLRLNLGDVTEADFRKIESRIQGLALKGLGSVRDLSVSYGALTSASPNLTHEQRLKMLEVGASVAPLAELQPVVEGLADTAHLTGSADAKENLGVMIAAQQMSRSTKLEDVAQYTMPAAANIFGAYGGTEAQALGLTLAVQSAMLDREGRRARTASLAGAQQLHEYFAPKAIREREQAAILAEENLGDFEKPNASLRNRVTSYLTSKGRKPANFEDAAAALKENPDLAEGYFQSREQEMGAANTPFKQIRYMQQHPEEREEFMGGMSLEREAIVPFQKLLTDPLSEIAKNMEAWGQTLPTGAPARRLAEEKIQSIGNDQYVRAQRTSLAGEASADKTMRENPTRGQTALIREAVNQALDASNTPTLEKTAINWAFDYRTKWKGEDPTAVGQSILNKRADMMTDPSYRQIPFFGTHPIFGEGEIPLERQQAAGDLRDLSGRLAELSPGAPPHTPREAAAGFGGQTLRSTVGGLPQEDYEATAVSIDSNGPGNGLRKHGIDDEYEMLRTGADVEQFRGHEEDLGKLESYLGGQIQHERETGGDSATVASIEKVHDALQKLIEQMQGVRENTGATATATKEAVGEQRAAGRSAGARATRGRGRE